MRLEDELKKVLIVVVAAGTFVSCGGGGGSGGSSGSEGERSTPAEKIEVKEGASLDLGVYSFGMPLPDRKCFEFSGAKEGEYSLIGLEGEYVATRKLDVNSIYFCVPPLDFPKICDKCPPGKYSVDLRIKGPLENSIIKNAGILEIQESSQ